MKTHRSTWLRTEKNDLCGLRKLTVRQEEGKCMCSRVVFSTVVLSDPKINLKDQDEKSD